MSNPVKAFKTALQEMALASGPAKIGPEPSESEIRDMGKNEGANRTYSGRLEEGRSWYSGQKYY